MRMFFVLFVCFVVFFFHKEVKILRAAAQFR